MKAVTVTDDNLNVTQMIKFVLDRVENIVGKGQNASNHHFLLFPQCFQKASSSASLKVRIVWERINSLPPYLVLQKAKTFSFSVELIQYQMKTF